MLFYFILIITSLVNGSSQKHELVQFSTNQEIQSLRVPISSNPVMVWMHLREGLYPNVHPINSEIKIGTPLSILIFFNDKSTLYDIKVNDCDAYNSEEDATYRLELYNEDRDNGKAGGKFFEWRRINRIEKYTKMLYTNFTAFKFPDKNYVYLTCNVEVCYKMCKLKQDSANEI